MGSEMCIRDSDLTVLLAKEKGIIQRDRIILENFWKKRVPITTVIGGGYSVDKSELASRHAIVFEVALEMI